MRPNIFPALHYRDADAALDFLKRAFGFEERAVYRGDDGLIHHAELRLGDGLVMFGGIPAGAPATKNGEQPPVTIYAVVTDPDQHYENARAAGAEIVRELADQPYGSREYGARDLEGNAWTFGSYDPYTE
ncbi:MAG TPA: VOC family protein [Solirubrobacteraceae bacterium]|nr:VOC family protein [Solirubrobacteraceae bacterium]